MKTIQLKQNDKSVREYTEEFMEATYATKLSRRNTKRQLYIVEDCNGRYKVKWLFLVLGLLTKHQLALKIKENLKVKTTRKLSSQVGSFTFSRPSSSVPQESTASKANVNNKNSYIQVSNTTTAEVSKRKAQMSNNSRKEYSQITCF